jgi:cell division septation protein DedD
MATFHREVYQPSFDDVPTHEFEEDDSDDARARLPLLIVIALLVLAAFAGVVWLAYNQGVEQGRVGVPTMIAAPEGPARTAPAEESAGVAYTGLKVYGEPVSPEEEAAVSNLAQPAQRPTLPPEPAPLRSTQPPAPVATAPPPAAVAPPPVQQVQAPSQQPAARATAPAPAPAAPAPVAATPAPAPAAPAPAVAAAPAGGGFVVQIASYPSEAEARSGWNTMKQRYGAVLANQTSDIKSADLGAKGTWYRLRIGPFADRAAADAACAQLKAQGGSCMIAAR